MTPLQLRLSPTEFAELPRSATHSYEFHDGEVLIQPRPRYYHAILDLLEWEPQLAADVAIAPLADTDWPLLTEVFAAAFAKQQPYGGLSGELRLMAARMALAQTRKGGDGPFVPQASFVARSDDAVLLGAALITLVPNKEPCDWSCCVWDEPPPKNCLEQKLGRPHLTWVFVRETAAGHGIGTALLSACADALLDLGFEELISTFMLGNDSSMLWHWRNGFRLLSYPGSSRGNSFS